MSDPGGEKAPDPRSRIPDPTGHKNRDGMKNKTNFFLAFYSFRSKFYYKNSKKISPKTFTLDSGSRG
jgi:hypothetical protein